MKRLSTLAAALFVTAAEALAQEKQTLAPRRLILVSIPDRKLALLEDGRVVKIYRTAVGRPSSPTPAGRLARISPPSPTDRRSRWVRAYRARWSEV